MRAWAKVEFKGPGLLDTGGRTDATDLQQAQFVRTGNQRYGNCVGTFFDSRVGSFYDRFQGWKGMEVRVAPIDDVARCASVEAGWGVGLQACKTVVNLRGDRRAAKKIWRGTDGSNPSPSSGESVANLPHTASGSSARSATDLLNSGYSPRRTHGRI